LDSLPTDETERTYADLLVFGQLTMIKISGLLATDGLSREILTAIFISIPILFGRLAALLIGGGRPVDGGYKLLFRRLIGNGVTWRGILGELLAGTACLAIFYAGFAGAVSGGPPPLILVVVVPVGSILGDVTESFLKRRLSYWVGDSLFLVDRLDSVIGAVALIWLTAPSWFDIAFSPLVLIGIGTITIVIHHYGLKLLILVGTIK
jgi:CDP-2,3-bis-(O-geranylgeranyl)-sn-glycerol synthase